MRSVLLPANIASHLPSPGSVLHRLQGQTMGTTWSVQVAAPPGAVPADVQTGIVQALDEVVAQMSHWEPGSDLGRYNRQAAGTWQEVPAHFWTVLSGALAVARLTQGAYDPAAGALVNAWGFGPHRRYDEDGFQPPDDARIRALVAPQQPGWRDVLLSPVSQRVLQPGGVWLDLAAVAKGYAVDLVSHHLSRRHLVHHLVEVGGELRGEGLKPDLQPWWVEMEALPSSSMSVEGIEREARPLMALHGLSVATSGDYRRFFECDGVRFSHTIDPRTGRPLTHGLAAVTVLHEQCMMADALSTALNVLGAAEGLAFANQHDIAACLVQREGHHLVSLMSDAFQAMLA